ncbi:hypothetical protein SLNSH_15635 [Alsobacter soli]|uniref:Uncharacterized protein n=1 Tax=Alsobacter soli TaxID=2109933 RepID=A0A2T1HQW0_9HYPH|nr:hypothetical protein [Alsobacter soli]PSC04041.1 hypothetical protein SLNSH_15635 [Alsobacter soli]
MMTIAHGRRLAFLGRNDLRDALQLVTVGLSSPEEVVRLDFKPGLLELTGPGAATAIDAQCEWSVTILVDAGAMARFADVLPDVPNLSLEVRTGQLFIGGTGFVMKSMMEVAPPAIQLPIGADTLQVLVAVAHRGEIAVGASLGQDRIEAAKADKQARIEAAASILKALGATRPDIENLVEAILRRHTK